MGDFGLGRSSEGFQIYEPDGDVLRAFLRDRSHVAIIRGPLGSGTSSACAMRIYMHAMEQPVNPATGKRHSRWFVIRDSYPSLRNTTIVTWLEWFPEELFGRFLWEKPARHEVRIGDIELDVIFMSAVEEADIPKFRSNDYTGIWFNELEYQKFIIFMEGESRTGRYPPAKKWGIPEGWCGVIADMNAPDETHWLPKLTGEVPADAEDADDEVLAKFKNGMPHDWAYFVQPPGVLEVRDQVGKNIVGYKTNPKAENIRWLRDGYYEQKCQGKTKAWIDSRLRNQITFVVDGSPVFKNFNPDTHIASEALEVVEGHDVIVGLDFGHSRPAALCVQVIDGRIFIQYEFRRYGMSAVQFAPQLKRFLEDKYRGCRAKFFGDPKGADRGQATDRTAYDIFKHNGMIVIPACDKQNRLGPRIAAVESVLGQLENGLPRFVLSPVNCPTFKAAMCGRYHTKKNALGDPEPVKDKYSDIADCGQYIFLGIGEGRAMIGLDGIDRMRPVMTSPGFGGGKFHLGGRKVG
jgi:hypothetical protein